MQEHPQTGHPAYAYSVYVVSRLKEFPHPVTPGNTERSFCVAFRSARTSCEAKMSFQ